MSNNIIEFDAICIRPSELKDIETFLNPGEDNHIFDDVILQQSSIGIREARNLTKKSSEIRDFNYFTLKNNHVIFESCDVINVNMTIAGVNNHIHINKNARLINSNINITGSNNEIVIGKECYVNGSGFCFHHGCSECRTIIGNFTRINGAEFEHADHRTQIILGEDCMLASGIDFMTSDTHSVINVDSNERINHGKDIILGDHVWIGKNVFVMKGVTIGDNSIVALGSIVTKSIPANVVVAGNPASIRKTNVSWKRELI